MSNLDDFSSAQAHRPERADCGVHHAGHTPHAIQVRLSQQSPPEDWQYVIVLGTVDDVVLLAVDGEVRRYRNHEPRLLKWVVGRVGPEAMLNPEYHALFCGAGPDGGRAVFSLQDAEDEPRPCVARDADDGLEGP